MHGYLQDQLDLHQDDKIVEMSIKPVFLLKLVWLHQCYGDVYSIWFPKHFNNLVNWTNLYLMNMLQVLLHDPAEHPQMSDQGFVVAPGTHTLVTILQKQVDWGYVIFAIGS